jgi:hypothetical protein
MARDMSRIRKVLLLPFLILIVITVINPLRWPKPFLEMYVDSITPIGMSFDNVMSEVDMRNWSVNYSDKTQGFFDQRAKPNQVVGNMSIRASLGDYQGLPLMTNVTVFWGFDKSGSLVDTWVWVTRDGL